MIIRKCSQGHRVRIHRNTTPGVTRTKKYTNGSEETIAYPSSYDYFIDVDGSVVKKTNSLKTAEETYTSECQKKHPDTEPHGRLNFGKHKNINYVATQLSDYPTSSNTKDEMKFFLDVRDVEYNASDTKSKLLELIEELKRKKIKITVKGVLHD